MEAGSQAPCPLTIWSDKSPAKTFAAISPVTARFPDSIPQVFPAETPDLPDAPVVLVMGSKHLKALGEAKVIPKNRSIASLRNKVWKGPNGQQLLFTYGPTIGDIDHGSKVNMLCDVALAYRLAHTGSIRPQIGSYHYVEDFSEAITAIDAAWLATGQKPVPCALDTETEGLDPYRPGAFIDSIQFSYEDGMAHVVTFGSKEEYDFRMAGELGNQLAYLLHTDRVRLRGANLKYDLNWLWVHGQFECSNFTMDTTAVGSCLDENRSNSLTVHASIYTGMGGYDTAFNATVDKGQMAKALAEDPDGFLTYAGGDTDACLRASKVMQREIGKQQGLARFYTTILHPALRAFEKVEQCGVLVDREAFNHLEHKLMDQMATSIKTIKEIAGGRLVAKHRDATKFMELNPDKAAFLCDYMFGPTGLNLKPKMMTAKAGKPSTAAEHLEMFQDHPEAKPFLDAYAAYTDAAKTMSTYCTGFLKHLREDGRFHPTYWLLAGDRSNNEGGANTGRLSCRDPAFQTIPKHTKWAKDLRRCFISPEGYLILENDYSQGELRVIACIANEPSMIEAYHQNMDLHALTAGPFRGFSYAEMVEMKEKDPALYKAIRQLGKAGNFGLIYGMSALGFEGVGGFINYARTAYSVTLTPKEATEFRDGFFSRYPVLLDYHTRYKGFAKQYGFVTSPLGRVRHLPLINSPDEYTRSKSARQAVNSPVQSTLSDMMIWAIALAYQRGWHKQTPCFGMVHDAKYTYVPEDNWQMYAAREKEIMETLPFEQVGWKPQLAFPVDGTLGYNLADMEELIFMPDGKVNLKNELKKVALAA